MNVGIKIPMSVVYISAAFGGIITLFYIIEKIVDFFCKTDPVGFGAIFGNGKNRGD
jgi:TRAP-type C4-dicarboxylate transport system permease small subunit